ncbi:MAG: prepilin-type N-terminal cleavage/methylation domain-containing protein [Nitrospiraceae bacterium]|nr:prepilin-type N-terminal cleavage/methylation domain-containing protein [Nitrospiraceae bacterium]
MIGYVFSIYFKYRYYNKGFTLVEVIISAVILFSALTLGTLAYRTSIMAVDRATAYVFIADALPTIMAKVKTEIIEHKNHGEGHYGESIAYTWNLKEIKSSKNILSSHDEFTGELEYGRFNVVLNNIHLTVTYSKDSRKKEIRYEYQELSWSS